MDSFKVGKSDAIKGKFGVAAGNTVSEIGMVLWFLVGDTEKVGMYMAAISTNEIDYEALSGRASNKEAYYQGVKSGSNSMYLIGLAVSAFGSYAAATGGPGFAAGAGALVTGAGALVGVPAMTVSAGVIALGAGVAVSGANISMTSQNSLNQAKGKLNELADQGDSDSTHMLGENGTQIGGSKTTGKNGGTERVDVENPAPGERPGDLHYHESNNTKWRYDVNTGNLVDPDTGELAPSRVQKVTEETWFQNAIKKGLKILGE